MWKRVFDWSERLPTLKRLLHRRSALDDIQVWQDGLLLVLIMWFFEESSWQAGVTLDEALALDWRSRRDFFAPVYLAILELRSWTSCGKSMSHDILLRVMLDNLNIEATSNSRSSLTQSSVYLLLRRHRQLWRGVSIAPPLYRTVFALTV